MNTKVSGLESDSLSTPGSDFEATSIHAASLPQPEHGAPRGAHCPLRTYPGLFSLQRRAVHQAPHCESQTASNSAMSPSCLIWRLQAVLLGSLKPHGTSQEPGFRVLPLA